jgi:hypothetical protein
MKIACFRKYKLAAKPGLYIRINTGDKYSEPFIGEEATPTETLADSALTNLCSKNQMALLYMEGRLL